MPGLAVLALFAAALPTAVVLQPVANMYSRPSTDADVVSQAIFGANVGILEQKDGWAHIYRESSVTKHAPLITVPFESRLEVVPDPTAADRWFRIRLPDDRTAWV